LEQIQQIQKIAILVNPLSGNGKAIKIGAWLTRELFRRHTEHESFSSAWPQTFETFSDIWIVGGDGTVNYFINQYQANVLPLFVFKGGTGNDFAWMLYGDRTLEEQLEIALTASPRKVDAGLCNGSLFVNSSGIGFDGEVLRSMLSIRWLGGHLGYLLVVIRKIFTFKEFSFRIKAGDEEYNERFLLVIVNNAARTGGGFMVTPAATINDGKLDMILCKPLGVFQRLRYLPVIEKGKHLSLPFILYSQEQKVRIEGEDMLYAQLDGELIRSKIFDLEILPGRLLIKY
jgi:diacylglycerol kinase family enzyme